MHLTMDGRFKSMRARAGRLSSSGRHVFVYLLPLAFVFATLPRGVSAEQIVLHRLVEEPDGTTAVYAGSENWPTPLLEKGKTWYFDSVLSKQGASAPEGAKYAKSQNDGTGDQGDLGMFTGKIVSLNGSLFILRDDANQVWYHLDDQTMARKFAGKDVDVNGKLDTATNVIHVQSIEEQNQPKKSAQ